MVDARDRALQVVLALPESALIILYLHSRHAIGQGRRLTIETSNTCAEMDSRRARTSAGGSQVATAGAPDGRLYGNKTRLLNFGRKGLTRPWDARFGTVLNTIGC